MSPRLLRLGLCALVLSCWPGADVSARPVAGPRPGPPALATARTADAEVAPLPSPISLSDPDGQALTLRALSAKVAVDGPLSLTELELRFTNPTDRRIGHVPARGALERGGDASLESASRPWCGRGSPTTPTTRTSTR